MVLHGGATVVLRWCYGGATGLLRWCYGIATVVYGHYGASLFLAGGGTEEKRIG